MLRFCDTPSTFAIEHFRRSDVHGTFQSATARQLAGTACLPVHHAGPPTCHGPGRAGCFAHDMGPALQRRRPRADRHPGRWRHRRRRQSHGGCPARPLPALLPAIHRPPEPIGRARNAPRLRAACRPGRHAAATRRSRLEPGARPGSALPFLISPSGSRPAFRALLRRSACPLSPTTSLPAPRAGMARTRFDPATACPQAPAGARRIRKPHEHFFFAGVTAKAAGLAPARRLAARAGPARPPGPGPRDGPGSKPARHPRPHRHIQ